MFFTLKFTQLVFTACHHHHHFYYCHCAIVVSTPALSPPHSSSVCIGTFNNNVNNKNIVRAKKKREYIINWMFTVDIWSVWRVSDYNSNRRVYNSAAKSLVHAYFEYTRIFETNSPTRSARSSLCVCGACLLAFVCACVYALQYKLNFNQINIYWVCYACSSLFPTCSKEKSVQKNRRALFPSTIVIQIGTVKQMNRWK